MQSLLMKVFKAQRKGKFVKMNKGMIYKTEMFFYSIMTN